VTSDTNPNPTPTQVPTPSPTPLPSGTFNFGSTNIGTSIDTGDSNSMNGSKITIPAPGGTVTSMSAHVGGIDASPNNQFQLGIYEDNNGVPGALIAHSGSGTLTANTWNSLPISATLAGNTSYWLMYNSNGASPSNNDMQFSVGSAGQGAFSNATTNFGSWPANFGLATLNNSSFSIYATLTTVGTLPSPSAAPSSSPNPCSGADINKNGSVDLLDYSVVISNFGKSEPSGTNGDINGNGSVDLLDYSTVISNFGKSGC
jgi:hypothetical protein